MKNRIAELRAEKGWTQAQLADILGVARQTIHAVESSKNEPGLAMAMRLSWLFGQPIETIFIADLDEKMEVMHEEWEHQDISATAFDEVGVLEQMGREGWEMYSFGFAVLHFRRPANPSLRRAWEYQRLCGLLRESRRTKREKEGWLFCGSWTGIFHYFKRETSFA